MTCTVPDEQLAAVRTCGNVSAYAASESSESPARPVNATLFVMPM